MRTRHPAHREFVTKAVASAALVVGCLASLTLSGGGRASGSGAVEPGRTIGVTVSGGRAARDSRIGGSEYARSAARPLVYIADQDVYCKYELYMTTATHPGGSLKLNPPLPVGGDVDVFALTESGDAVVYVADQHTADRFELFVVTLAAPAAAVKLSAPLGIGRDVREFALGPDDRTIVYRADHDANDVWELYAVDIRHPAEAVKLSAPLADGEHVLGGYFISADGTKVFYRSGRDEDGAGEGLVVDIDAPRVARPVNISFAAEGDGAHGRSSLALAGRQVAARPSSPSGARMRCAHSQHAHRSMR